MVVGVTVSSKWIKRSLDCRCYMRPPLRSISSKVESKIESGSAEHEIRLMCFLIIDPQNENHLLYLVIYQR